VIICKSSSSFVINFLIKLYIGMSLLDLLFRIVFFFYETVMLLDFVSFKITMLLMIWNPQKREYNKNRRFENKEETSNVHIFSPRRSELKEKASYFLICFLVLTSRKPYTIETRDNALHFQSIQKIPIFITSHFSLF